jgi:hypothetical protein
VKSFLELGHASNIEYQHYSRTANARQYVSDDDLNFELLVDATEGRGGESGLPCHASVVRFAGFPL